MKTEKGWRKIKVEEKQTREEYCLVIVYSVCRG